MVWDTDGNNGFDVIPTKLWEFMNPIILWTIMFVSIDIEFIDFINPQNFGRGHPQGDAPTGLVLS
jgi:hypothetical protein